MRSPGCWTKRGVRIANFEAMPLVEQIGAMRQARMVWWPSTGPHLANILFCRPWNPRDRIISTPASAQPAFWSMASCCGLGYGFLIGRHVPSERAPTADWNADYDVPIDDLLRALDTQLASEAGVAESENSPAAASAD